VVTAAVLTPDLLLLPLVFWAGYVHDGAYGLRTQGFGGWFYDWGVYHLPVWLGVGALTLVGYRTAVWWPRLWAPLAGIGAGLIAGLLAFVSPLVLEPLTFRFEPLPPGPVREVVEEVLAAAGEQVNAIVVADASRRSTRQNAYISGLGASERVVLYDTLIDQRPPDEIGVILAHELSHQRNADVARFVLLSVAGGVTSTYALWAVLRRRTAARRQSGPADPRAAGVVFAIVVLLTTAGMPVQSLVSRRAEAAADLGSLTFTDAPEVFARMQQGLARANITEPSPPRAVTWWWGSHPSPMARITMARWWEQR
jgi:STE24 endopeptidase